MLMGNINGVLLSVISGELLLSGYPWNNGMGSSFLAAIRAVLTLAVSQKQPLSSWRCLRYGFSGLF